MKIAHLCLCGGFTDGMGYQENELVKQHVSAGHEVMILASIEAYGSNNEQVFVEPGEWYTNCGAKLKRLRYSYLGPRAFMQKIRKFSGVLEELKRFQPDSILFHGLSSWELRTVAEFKRMFPKCKFYADCHADKYNSARTWISRNILHRWYYRPILLSSLSSIDKILCITVEAMQFAREIYGIQNRSLELYPLGGVIPTEEEYEEIRNRVRNRLALKSTDIFMLQTGKIDRSKKLIESLTYFTRLRDPSLVFGIAGRISSDIQREVTSLISNDERIRDFGWQNSDSLQELLCAADVYIQPSGQTVTTQRSICCKCAIVVSDVPSHRMLFNENGYLLNATFPLDVAMSLLVRDKSKIELMKKNSHALASSVLNYENLARRILQ